MVHRFTPFRAALLALCLALPASSSASASVTTRNFTLLSHVDDYPVPAAGLGYAYSACWSYLHGDGREYAILGVSSGVAIYNVTDPAQPYRVAFVPGPGSIWRESKSYRNWIYVVSEGSVGPNVGLQIIRMTDPEHPVLAAVFTTTFTHAHTISVDTTRALLYCNGTRDSSGLNVGMHVLSIASPEAPVELARWPATPYAVPANQYIHDCVPVGTRLFAASIYADTVRVFDVSTPSQPTPIAAWSYPGPVFTHNVWPDSSGQFLYATDERNGQTLRIFDIANLAAPAVLNGITSNPLAIIHNAHVRGHELYLSNYTEGIRALDISDPAHPAEFGWADSYPGASGGYGGVWEVCPYFPSGTVIASDMQSGLYVYRPVRDYGVLRVKVVRSGSAAPLAGIPVHLTTQGDSLLTAADGVVQFAPGPGSHTVLVHAFGWVDASATRTVSAGGRDSVTLAMTERPRGAFSGVIRDGAGAPIADAELRLAFTTLEARTDSLGAYAFADVPDDVYRLEVRHAGYASVTVVRAFGPGHPGQDETLVPAASWDAFESASGWTVGAPGDDATAGQWTRVTPQGAGGVVPGSAVRPAAHDARRGHAPGAPMTMAMPMAHGMPMTDAMPMPSSPPRGARALAFGGACTAPCCSGGSGACGLGAAASPSDTETVCGCGLALPGSPATFCGCGMGSVQSANDVTAPYADHTPGGGTMCFVTGQGTDPTDADQADVDGGRTTLTSPALDVTGLARPTIGYWRWFYSLDSVTGHADVNDALIVELSVDGGAEWIAVDSTRAQDNRWTGHDIDVKAFATPAGSVRVRFVALDGGGNSTVEAAIDDVMMFDAEAGSGGPPPAPPPALRVHALRPNPAAGAVSFSVDVPRAGEVTVDVLDVGGRRVRALRHGSAAPGTLALGWDGADDRGVAAPAGLYFVRARLAGLEASARVVRTR